jgi:hypothetical protein
MAQRFVEILIGRLITDEEFRTAFVAHPQSTLARQLELGMQLTQAEIDALMATNAELWESLAPRIDPRLQKASLKGRSSCRQ